MVGVYENDFVKKQFLMLRLCQDLFYKKCINSEQLIAEAILIVVWLGKNSRNCSYHAGGKCSSLQVLTGDYLTF
jgi:hypothetical protein